MTVNVITKSDVVAEAVRGGDNLQKPTVVKMSLYGKPVATVQKQEIGLDKVDTNALFVQTPDGQVHMKVERQGNIYYEPHISPNSYYPAAKK